MRPTTLLKNNVLYWTLRTYNTSGVLTDADSTPTVAVRKNGSSTGDSVTVTKRTATTGIYDCSYNPASEVEGDTFTIEESATVGGTAGSWNWSCVVVDAYALASKVVGTLASGTHNPQSGDSYARLGAPAGASTSADIAAVLAAVQANGGGTGANAVSITINDGSTPLTAAKVRVTQGSESYVVSTNGSGVAAFDLDDATWTVRLTKPGYTLAAQTLVVNGAESVTYSMTAVSVSTPSAPNLSVGTLLCLGTDGQEEEGAKVYFRLIEGPGTAGYSLDATEWYETADADGQIEAEFIIGATYGAHRGDVGREVKFTVANGASFSLPENLGSP